MSTRSEVRSSRRRMAAEAALVVLSLWLILENWLLATQVDWNEKPALFAALGSVLDLSGAILARGWPLLLAPLAAGTVYLLLTRRPTSQVPALERLKDRGGEAQ